MSEEQIPEQVQACLQHLKEARDDQTRVRNLRREVVKRAREGGTIGDITAEVFDELLSLHAQSARSLELLTKAVAASFDFTGEIASEMDERLDEPSGEYLTQYSFNELRIGLLFGLEAAGEVVRVDPSKGHLLEALQRALQYLESIEVEPEEEEEQQEGPQGPLSPGQIQELVHTPTAEG